MHAYTQTTLFFIDGAIIIIAKNFNNQVKLDVCSHNNNLKCNKIKPARLYFSYSSALLIIYHYTERCFKKGFVSYVYFGLFSPWCLMMPSY